MPMITKTCLTCGKEFQVWPSRSKSRFYCSRSCTSAHKTIEKVCKACGKEFRIGASKKDQEHCSRDCRYPPLNRGVDQTKQCSTCGNYKPETEFRSQKRACKKCEQARSKEYNRSHREERQAYNALYRNTHAERLRAHRQTEEYRAWHREQARRANRRNPELASKRDLRYRKSHKEQLRAYRKKYRKRNLEKIRTYMRGYLKKYRSKNKHRFIQYRKTWALRNPASLQAKRYAKRAFEKQIEGSYSALEWQTLCRKYDYRCLRCGKREPDIKLTVDHIIPTSRGGTNYIDNIQPLCGECNSSKGTNTIDYRPETTKREQYEQMRLF